MLKIGLQFFAHKKGVGSTRNGRDSEAKRLGASVAATVVKNGKGKKVRIFKYNPKKGYRKRQGHRQPYTKVQIGAIQA